ncbi:MAG: YigZ family protein [Gemmatimonadota bacterium]
MAVGRAAAELREKGSRFLALAAAAGSEAEARDLREGERRLHHDATHHVFAWRSAAGEERWDDDGEPAGTGGRPLLGAIESAGLADVAVVVTRWFGGTKLGTGGLARAYGAAGARALAGVAVAAVRPGRVLRIRHGWEDTGAVASALEAMDALRLAERYDAGVEIDVAVAEREVGSLESALREATAGRARVRRLPGAVRVPLRP